MTIEFRDAVLELRSETEDEWTVAGLAVPFNQIASAGDYSEQFERGSFSEVEDNVPLFYGHGHRNGEAPIGRITEHRESDEGLNVVAKISKTARGTEIYQLLKDGVLSKFSVGFEPISQRDDDGIVVRTKARLRELSIVPMPAYAGASISKSGNQMRCQRPLTIVKTRKGQT